MYVNDLGMRNLDKVNSRRVNSYGRSRSSGSASAGGEAGFAKQLEAAAGRTQEAEGASAESCCEQCRENGRLITRLMTQSLYMQSGLGGTGLLGYPSVGTGNLAAYRSMMNLLGGQLYSMI